MSIQITTNCEKVEFVAGCSICHQLTVRAWSLESDTLDENAASLLKFDFDLF